MNHINKFIKNDMKMFEFFKNGPRIRETHRADQYLIRS